MTWNSVVQQKLKNIFRKQKLILNKIRKLNVNSKKKRWQAIGRFPSSDNKNWFGGYNLIVRWIMTPYRTKILGTGLFLYQLFYLTTKFYHWIYYSKFSIHCTPHSHDISKWNKFTELLLKINIIFIYSCLYQRVYELVWWLSQLPKSNDNWWCTLFFLDIRDHCE